MHAKFTLKKFLEMSKEAESLGFTNFEVSLKTIHGTSDVYITATAKDAKEVVARQIKDDVWVIEKSDEKTSEIFTNTLLLRVLEDLMIEVKDKK